MIRRAVLLVLMLLVATAVLAQADNPASQAHGTEKTTHEKAHPTEEHGEHGEAPKTYFGIPGWILKFLNMLAFLGLIGYFVVKAAKPALAARTIQIQEEAKLALERRERADRTASEIQARLTQIEQEVRSIRERAEAEGQRQRQELMAAAEAEAAKILQAARNEVDNRLKHARHELTEYAGELAAQRAKEILREKVTDADRARLFEESLSEIGEVRS